jgi:hypothetical protein
MPVSNVNQPSVTPLASLPSPWILQFEARAFGIVPSSMAWICAGPASRR